MLPGALLAIGGHDHGDLSAEERPQPRGPASGEPPPVIVTVLGVLGRRLGRASPSTGRETVSDEAAANADLVVDLEDFEFDEDAYEVPAGGTVLVKNEDPVIHTFTIEDLDIDVDLGPGSEKLVEMPERRRHLRPRLRAPHVRPRRSRRGRHGVGDHHRLRLSALR